MIIYPVATECQSCQIRLIFVLLLINFFSIGEMFELIAWDVLFVDKYDCVHAINLDGHYIRQ